MEVAAVACAPSIHPLHRQQLCHSRLASPRSRLALRSSSSGAELWIRRSNVGVRAMSSDGTPEYRPRADFYKVEAIVRPWRLSQVSGALLRAGIRGVTVSDVRGLGAQGGALERHAGSEFSEDKFVTKIKMEIVVSADQVELVIDTVLEEARTGEIGDGKIFVIPVADVIRVRTGERGLQAERMVGGRADILSSTT
ncbi:nitrogen regulatory protein P-II homolog [Selaginella moellendorffii]|nr:nitrogen regulatory protein P-II homolog [Selaginella moellendorffii]|eukprot:XP_002965031.2 nitrogen regulatory protein P-II homolog [Selaginella moellendorffii]